MNKKPYLLILIIVLLAYLLYILLKPLLTAILGSLILTFVFYRVFTFFNKKIKKPALASTLTLVLILLIIIIPSIILINSLAQESVSVYHSLRTQDVASVIANYLESNQLQEYIGSVINNALFFIVNSTSDFILSLPQLALTFFVIMFLTYYLLKESDVFLAYLKKYIPIKESKKEIIFEKFKVLTSALIFGTILTAIIQGVLGGIGFAIFGISSPILWGFMMAIASIIPFVGTAIVWLPAGLIQLFQHDYVSGIGILIFGGLIVGTADNFIKPKLVGKRANIHPAIVLIGILGGLNLLGFIGLIIGPLILALAIELFKMRGEFI
jgi:predicted PurR-regulated permease PerM